MAQSLSEYNTGPYISTTLRSHSLPSGLNEVSAGPVASDEHNDRSIRGDLRCLTDR